MIRDDEDLPVIEQVTIGLLEVPRAGSTMMIARMREADSRDVNRAAKRLGMKQSEFLRTTLINAARKINAE